MNYFPFPGCEEFCQTLRANPNDVAATLLVRNDSPLVRRALYRAVHYNNTYYLYRVECEGRHFGDGMPLCETHVAATLEDLQRAFGLDASSPPKAKGSAL